MRNPEEAKKVLASLKKIQNIIYWCVLAEIAFGFINSWIYTISEYKYFWLGLIAINIFFVIRGLLQFQRGNDIVWELENEINSN